MATEKAYLEIEGGEKLPCMFNPSELQMARANQWSADAMPGQGVQTLRFDGAQSATMGVSLFFDTTAEGAPVTKYTSKVLKLMEIDPGLPGADERSNNARPPWVKLHWGDWHSFKSVIASLDLTFVYFTPKGVPLRAKLTLQLTQYEEDLTFAKQNPTSGTPDPHRVHRVQPGETLDRIAALHYGDSTMWRVIANANGVQDPMAVRPGAILAIPRVE